MAAAGAADGALGLDRPPRRITLAPDRRGQDFSRSAEAPRIIGRAAVAPETPATEVSRASTAAKPLRPGPPRPARSVRTGSPRAAEVAQQPGQQGQQAAEHRHRHRPVLGGSGTGFRVRRPASSRDAVRPVRHRDQQAVDVGFVVVVHQAGPDGPPESRSPSAPASSQAQSSPCQTLTWRPARCSATCRAMPGDGEERRRRAPAPAVQRHVLIAFRPSSRLANSLLSYSWTAAIEASTRCRRCRRRYPGGG